MSILPDVAVWRGHVQGRGGSSSYRADRKSNSLSLVTGRSTLSHSPAIVNGTYTLEHTEELAARAAGLTTY